jgi:hypothetical protein
VALLACGSRAVRRLIRADSGTQAS